MFCCLSAEQSEKPQKATTKKVDAYKILLLGPGESGKSTFSKQMKILHKHGFQSDEIAYFKTVIFHNVLSSMKAACTASVTLGLTSQFPEDEPAVREFLEAVDSHSGMDPELGTQLTNLWGLRLVQETLKHYTKFQLIDTAPYFFENLDRIARADYVPTHADILKSRAKTTGIIEISFQMDGSNFRLIDVGGQRSERKKWIHCFEDVHAVLFVIAMSEYNLTLAEDNTVNRLDESLRLFKETVNSKWFVETPVILFLNKKDLFAEKIKKGDLATYFPDYTGGADYNRACEWMEQKFRAQLTPTPNAKFKKQLYVHFTCATDTNNVDKVFRDCKSMMITSIFSDAGLLN